MIYKNATIMTVNEQNEILVNYDLEVIDGIITRIEKDIDCSEVIDLSGLVIMPGFINTHAHMPMSIFRSLAEEDDDRLRKYMFPIEGKFITPKTVACASRFTLLETIASGQTTIADMYYYNHKIADVHKEVGVRNVAFETIIDEGGDSFNHELGQIKHFDELYQKYANDDSITCGIAPHAPYTNSLASLKKCHEISQNKNLKMMIHVSEMAFEQGEFRGEKSVISYLDKHGILDENTIIVHALYLSDFDYEIIAKNKCSVVHVPVSNAKGGRKIMDHQKLSNHGVNISLGTDGAMSGNRQDMHSVMYFASKIQKHANGSRSYLSNRELIRMATINGAKTLGLDHLIGSIELGKKADFIVIDPNMYNMLPNYDLEASIVNALDSSNIKQVYVDGNLIYKNSQYLTIDKEKTIEEFIDLTAQIREYVNI